MYVEKSECMGLSLRVCLTFVACEFQISPLFPHPDIYPELLSEKKNYGNGNKKKAG